MQVFIAGIMQGSRQDLHITSQNYRDQIAALIREHIPQAEIIDPNQIHPDGVNYDRELAKKTLIEMAQRAAEVNCLIAYVPEASMGTALEMWHAYSAGVPVYTISPMEENWVIFSLSEQVFPDMAAFGEFVAAGGLV